MARQQQSEEIDRAALGRLIASTRRRKRPRSLVRIASDIDFLCRKRGGLGALADDLDISESMLRRFLLVRRLTPQILSLVDDRSIDSIDAVAELSSLSASNQKRFAELYPRQPLSTEDIRGIVRLAKAQPEANIESIIAKVVAARTKRLYVYEFVVRESAKKETLLLERFRQVIPESMIAGIEIKGSVGRLKLDAAGRLALSTARKPRGTTLTQFVQSVANGSIL